MEPVVEVGARLAILDWPADDEEGVVHLVGKVARIHKRKKRPMSTTVTTAAGITVVNETCWKYYLLCDDGEIRSTRLVHLKWKHLHPLPLFTQVVLPQHIDYRYILAPMVGASELPFRLLCRKYGATLAYTPMMSSVQFSDKTYREKEFQTTPEDRPLVAHFSANNAQILLEAAKLIEHQCDAIDINLGCPQRVACVGHFGSFLLDLKDRDIIIDMVQTLNDNLSIPVFVKIRLLDTVEETITLCTQLYEAGAKLIAIHARYRVNLTARSGPGARDGGALLDQVAAIRNALPPQVIIISNGNVIHHQDISANITTTKADGIMCAEGILDNPLLFTHPNPPSDVRRLQLGIEYLEIENKYPATIKSVIFHTRRICHAVLTKYQLLQDLLVCQDSASVMHILLKALHYAIEGGFIFDEHKDKLLEEALARKKYEEGKRKEYEKRMMRKAKRDNLPLDHYLLVGIEAPTADEISDLKALTPEDRLTTWRASNHAQLCMDHILSDGGCLRGRACAFLHTDPAEPPAYG